MVALVRAVLQTLPKICCRQLVAEDLLPKICYWSGVKNKEYYKRRSVLQALSRSLRNEPYQELVHIPVPPSSLHPTMKFFTIAKRVLIFLCNATWCFMFSWYGVHTDFEFQGFNRFTLAYVSFTLILMANIAEFRYGCRPSMAVGQAPPQAAKTQPALLPVKRPCETLYLQPLCSCRVYAIHHAFFMFTPF